MPSLDSRVLKIFGEVREALARATFSFLNADIELAQRVIYGDQEIDDATAEVELLVWSEMDAADLDRTASDSLSASS